LCACKPELPWTMAPCYFLLYCEEDVSHAVVPASDVVFKNVPSKNELVTFYYDTSSSQQRSYTGRVIEIGGEFMSGYMYNL